MKKENNVDYDYKTRETSTLFRPTSAERFEFYDRAVYCASLMSYVVTRPDRILNIDELNKVSHKTLTEKSAFYIIWDR